MKTFTRDELISLANAVSDGVELDKETTLRILQYTLALRDTRDSDLKALAKRMREEAAKWAEVYVLKAKDEAVQGNYAEAYECSCKADGLKEYALLVRVA